jgi:hypothetical protein
MTLSVIAQLSRQRVAGGGRLDRLNFLRRLGTNGSRHGHMISGVAWDIGYVWQQTVDSDLME